VAMEFVAAGNHRVCSDRTFLRQAITNFSMCWMTYNPSALSSDMATSDSAQSQVLNSW